jgi:hypothetical protein
MRQESVRGETVSHWRHRRDGNENELVRTLESLGALWIQTGPFDGWAFWRGRWHLCEIKLPEREGRAGEYTPAQLLLIQKLRERNVPWYTLRTDEDVYALLGARRTA